MSSKSDLRVCVSVGEQISRLLSVKERQNGDLVLNMRSAEFYRETENVLKNDAPRITNQKYSIHCSKNSKDRINAIVHRIKFCNDKECTTSNYTKALKQTNKYAPIYAARAPDLSLQKYYVNPDERRYLSISSFDTKLATLYYMLVVCNHVSETIPDGDDYSIKYFEFTHFKLAIIWSYSPLPSHSSGLKRHFMTIPLVNSNSSKTKIIQEVSEGYGASDMIDMYRKVRYSQHLELLTLIKKEITSMTSSDFKLMSSLPFTSKARTGRITHTNHERSPV